MSSPTVLGPVSTLARYADEGEVSLDFSRSLPPGFVLSRATPGSYVDLDGYPRIAAENVPMFQSDGMLMDGANTNFLIKSEWDSGSAGWNMNSGISMDLTYKYGDITMARVRELSGTMQRIMYYLAGRSIPVIAGTPMCVSAFLRYVPGSTLSARVIMFRFTGTYDDGAPIQWRVYFRPNSGSTVPNFLNDGEGSFNATFRMRDDVRRFGWECTPVKSGTINSVQIYYADGGSVNSFEGDGVSAIDVGGLQLSYGKLTSYIRTGDSATTRAMDTVLGPVANVLGPAGDQGTVFADLDVDGFGTSWTVPIAFRPNLTNSTNRFYVTVSTNNTSKWQIGSPVNFNPGGMPFTFPGTVKTALRVNPADIRSITNGQLNTGSAGTGSPASVGAVYLQAPEYRRFLIRQIRSVVTPLTGDDLFVPTRV